MATETEQQLHDELDRKQAELEALQKSFDDYAQSSKELEAELEAAVEQLSAENAELVKEGDNAKQSIKILELQLQALKKNLPSPSAQSKQQQKSFSGSGDDSELNQKRVSLEIENENLRDQVHILKATEEDLEYKLQKAEEEIIFVKSELEGYAESKSVMEEELTHYKLEVENLREEVERTASALQQQGQTPPPTSASRSDDFGVEPADVHLSETVHQLEVQLEDTKKQLEESAGLASRSIEQVDQLQRELEQKERMLAARPSQQVDHTVVVDLKNEVYSLQQQLAQRVTTAQLAEKDAIIQELQAELEDFMDASNREKQQLVQEMSSKISTISEELNQAKASSVSSSIANRTGGTGFVADCVISSAVDNKNAALVIDGRSSVHRQLERVIGGGSFDEMKDELVNMAGKLEQVRNSNIKLLNKMQAMKGNIQVCCRTRPASEQELSQNGRICIDAADDSELMCYDSRVELWKSFFFDRVWNAEANQADVFSDVEPMVVSVLDGYNACILAYGQTGSGKTFTMDGYGDYYGVSYRSIQLLFDLLEMRKEQYDAHYGRLKGYRSFTKNNVVAAASNGNNADTSAGNGRITGRKKERQSMVQKTQSFLEYDNPLATPKTSPSKEMDFGDVTGGITMDAEVDSDEEKGKIDGADKKGDEDEGPQFSYSLKVSMLEIYNEQVYDLLDNSVGGGQNKEGLSTHGSLDIRQGPDNSVGVPGLQEIPVSSINDVQQVFGKGMANRATSSTNLNEHSSRSHLIVTVEVMIQRGQESAVKSKLHLVDLAGSERVHKSGVTGAEMKEAQHINKSLSALGDVMEALDKKSKHVPYRNSKLTYLLQNSLGGNARTMMIVTVCPTDLSFDESLFTLQFATRVRNISLGPAQKQSNVKNLEESLKLARTELKDLRKRKSTLEEQLNEIRKEQRKAPSSALVEAKMKSIEEAKKAGEILMQQLNRQITESNARLTEEKDMREQLAIDLDLTQRNLKKALDQVKELTREIERLNLLIRRKDREMESLQNQQNARASIHAPAQPLGSTAGRRSRDVSPMNSRTNTATGRSTSPRAVRGGVASTATPPATVRGGSGPASRTSPRPAQRTTSPRATTRTSSVTSTPVASRIASSSSAATPTTARSSIIPAARSSSPRGFGSSTARESSPRAPSTRTPQSATSRLSEVVEKKNANKKNALKKTDSTEKVVLERKRSMSPRPTISSGTNKSENNTNKTKGTPTDTSVTITSGRRSTSSAGNSAIGASIKNTSASAADGKPKVAFGSALRKSAGSEQEIRRSRRSLGAVSSSGTESSIPAYMRPTSSVMNRHSEEAAANPVQRRTRSLSPQKTVQPNSRRLIKAGSFLSKIPVSEVSRTWKDAIEPTTAFALSVKAAQEEHKQHMEEKEKKTHAVGDASFAVPVKKDGLLPQRSILVAHPSFKDKTPTPKGHRTWEDATAPTESYIAQRDAAAAEHDAIMAEEAHRIHGHEPEHDGPKEPTPSPPQSHHKSFKESNPTPKGHKTWHDALQPTASFSAHIASPAHDNADADHGDHTGRSVHTGNREGAASRSRSPLDESRSGGRHSLRKQLQPIDSKTSETTSLSGRKLPPTPTPQQHDSVAGTSRSTTPSVGGSSRATSTSHHRRLPSNEAARSFLNETEAMAHAVKQSSISSAVAFGSYARKRHSGSSLHADEHADEHADDGDQLELDILKNRLENRKRSLQALKESLDSSKVDDAKSNQQEDEVKKINASAFLNDDQSSEDEDVAPYPEHEQISY